MSDQPRENLLNNDDEVKVRALGIQRSSDRAMQCTHQVLVKVIDRLGMMTSTWVDGQLVTGAPVLEAHYECQDCGRTMLQTANAEALEAYNTHLEMTAKFTAVAEAIDGVRSALSRRKENR